MSSLSAKVFILTLVAACLGISTGALADGKKILVNVGQQKLYAVQANKLVYEFDVVTGKPGKETTVGDYRVFRKVKDYTSKTYGSPMPFSMFFSEDGKAIHATSWAVLRSYLHAYLTESVGSMGCVGLTEEDAAELYKWTPKGTLIVILEGKSHEEKRLAAYKKAGDPE
jgi:lipoprotein-anchoring transpeptidase ErfK/SrfK